ncbi:RNA-binding domain-containing protein [Favolaschia claudopus]|uniref:RNA-binding domain-containing protein n=1 Tax=Favolaschia claudopus TaxID=2862362 RepID=A0AAW0E8M5_9AGAR
MSTRGRSASPPAQDQDAPMEGDEKSGTTQATAKVVIINNLSRNVVETHLKTIFGFYGEIVQIDLPLYAKSGQNRGKAALEYADPPSAQKAASHMNGGQIDGAVVKVELSDLPVRSRSRSPPPPRRPRNGPGRPRSFSRSRSRSRSPPGTRLSSQGSLTQPHAFTLSNSPWPGRSSWASKTFAKLSARRVWQTALGFEELFCSLQPFTLSVHVAFSVTLAVSFLFVVFAV